MSDLVNDYFKRFYPADDVLKTTEWEHKYVGGGGYAIKFPKIEGYSTVFPEMVCADGFRMSVQGHCGAHSSPRDDWASQYHQVEIMIDPGRENLFEPYSSGGTDDDSDWNIYAYVPVEVVEQVIKKHGGLATKASQPDSKEGE